MMPAVWNELRWAFADCGISAGLAGSGRRTRVSPCEQPTIPCGRVADDTNPREPQASQSASPWRDSLAATSSMAKVDSSVRLKWDWGGFGPPVSCWVYLTRMFFIKRRIAPKSVARISSSLTALHGEGRCGRPATTGYTVQRSANDVLEVLDSLKPSRNRSWSGTSWLGRSGPSSGRNIRCLNGTRLYRRRTDPRIPNQPRPDPAPLPRSIQTDHMS